MKAKRISWLLLAAALGLTAQAAHSASITVDAGGVCTLAEAITSANNDNAAGNGCVNGSGADIITLQMDVTLAAVLPTIASAITIEGGGKTINGNNGNFSVLKIVSGGNLTLKNATITGGHPLADNGGGIYADTGSTVILNSCTVSGNTAGGSFGGGIYAASLATVTLNNSTVSGNTCSISGGGIGAGGDAAAVTLNNSTVSNNTANGTVTGGGGIIVIESGASITLRSSIVSGNTAPAPNVDGDEVYTANSGIITANSSNVFGHSGETGAQAFSGFTPGASDVNATSDGTTPKALNLILNTTLANNGGPTQTHALVVGSPAIDRDATCSTGLSTDQRGYTRQINFKCDAGAVEYSPSFSLASGNGRDLRARTWLMTAPPCAPVPSDIGSQYGSDIPGGAAAYGISWIGYAWDAAATQYVQLGFGTPLTPGNGSWLYSLNAATLTVTGTATPTVPCSNYGSGLSGNCFAINLTPSSTARWQIVGHPFPYNVSWADVRVATCGSSCGTPANWTQRTPTQAAAASIMAKEMQRWSGSSYQPKDDNVAGGMLGTLLPHEAVWVRMLPGSSAFLSDEIKLLVPAR